jgi:hypothetical protein
MTLKLSLIGFAVLAASFSVAQAKDSQMHNTISIEQAGDKIHQAEISQEGSGNRVVIRQGGASAPMQDESADRLHFEPRKHQKQHWHRAKHGDSQNLHIEQQGGGKLRVESRSGEGKVETNVVSDKAD